MANSRCYSLTANSIPDMLSVDQLSACIWHGFLEEIREWWFGLAPIIDLSSQNIFTSLQKVKCALVQALRLCTGRTVHRGSRGIALLIHHHGIRRGRRVRVTPRPFFAPGKDPVPVVQEAGWAPGPVWTGAENLAPPGFDLRTVQPVASRYTDCATPAHFMSV